MEDWDQETLEKAIAEKSKEYNQNKPTDIVIHFPLFSSPSFSLVFYFCWVLWADRYVTLLI